MEEQVKVKKSIFKKWWFWVIIVIFIGIIANAGDDNKTSTEQVSIDETTKGTQAGATIAETIKETTIKPAPKPTEAKKPDYEILEYDDKTDEFGSLIIVGKIKNNTGKEQSYVQVEINLYDKDGAQVGSTLANVNNLEVDAIWAFEAYVLEENVASYKIKDVTGF